MNSDCKADEFPNDELRAVGAAAASFTHLYMHVQPTLKLFRYRPTVYCLPVTFACHEKPKL